MQRLYMVRKENQPQFQLLVNIVNEQGHPALSAAHVQILEYVGSFPEANGCWASDKGISDQTIKAKSPKTIRVHLAYLVAIKALSVTKTGKGRTYRLGAVTGPVMSQKQYRVSKGMSEYAYAKPAKKESKVMSGESTENIDNSWFIDGEKEEKTAKKQAIFLAEAINNFAAETANLAPEEANFAPILNSTNTESTKLEQKLPPKVPPRIEIPVEDLDDFDPVSGSGVAGSLRDPEDRPNSRPILAEVGECRLRDEPKSFMISKKNGEDEWSEPLYEKKRVKRPKTEAERRLEATKQAAKGHIVNPNGTPDNRKKEVNWKLARDIGDTGAVTIPQLWRHLVKLWDKSFGPGIIENMLSKDKSALTRTFGELRQTFITLFDFEPSNRDLAEYFDWFLEPKRLDSILNSGKYADPGKPKIEMHFRQLGGSVFLTRFYQEVILKRKQAEVKPTHGVEMSKADAAVLILDQRFSRLRATYDDNWKFLFAMVQTGYALTAQFLYDEKGMTDSECRQRIIQCMAEFIRESSDKPGAVEHLKSGIENTKNNAHLLRKDVCVWFEWQEKTKDLIEVAVQQSGVDIK